MRDILRELTIWAWIFLVLVFITNSFNYLAEKYSTEGTLVG